MQTSHRVALLGECGHSQIAQRAAGPAWLASNGCFGRSTLRSWARL